MNTSQGRIEVICGSMFSGKTEELIRRIRRAIIARQNVQVFKPSLDYRYGIEKITSHNKQTIEAEPMKRSQDIFAALKDNTTVVAVDEAQFFDENIVDVVNELADRGLRVIVGGLDLDFRGEPFGAMPRMMALAEEVVKLQAICVVCSRPASRTQRLVDGNPAYYDDPVVMIGAEESYEARCRKCHEVPIREEQQKLL